MRAHDGTPKQLLRLKRRSEFLRVGKGRRWHGTAMTVQTAVRVSGTADATGEKDVEPARFGFTLTKKVGNAVVRNRARRRLREAVRLAPDLPARAGHDYVIVGRTEAIRLPFEALSRELARGVAAVHESGKRREPGTSGQRSPTERPVHQRPSKPAAFETLKAGAQTSTNATRQGRHPPERIKPEP